MPVITTSDGKILSPKQIKMLEMQKKRKETGGYSMRDLIAVLGDPNYSIKIGGSDAKRITSTA